MDDLISRQAAIDILMKEWKAYKDYPYVSHVRHGLEIAIAILENKVPSAQPTQKNESNTLDALDCVSREAVMDLIIETDPYWAEGMTRAIYNGVSKMPSAQPEIIRCKFCKYYPNNPRPYADNDPIETFIHCQFMEANDFCSKGKAITEERE